MHITWQEVVTALAHRGEHRPQVQPGLQGRVLQRLSREGILPDKTASQQDDTLRPDTRAGTDVPIAARD